MKTLLIFTCIAFSVIGFAQISESEQDNIAIEDLTLDNLTASQQERLDAAVDKTGKTPQEILDAYKARFAITNARQEKIKRLQFEYHNKVRDVQDENKPFPGRNPGRLVRIAFESDTILDIFKQKYEGIPSTSDGGYSIEIGSCQYEYPDGAPSSSRYIPVSISKNEAITNANIIRNQSRGLFFPNTRNKVTLADFINDDEKMNLWLGFANLSEVQAFQDGGYNIGIFGAEPQLETPGPAGRVYTEIKLTQMQLAYLEMIMDRHPGKLELFKPGSLTETFSLTNEEI